MHHPSSFTEESRPLLRFLLREFEDLQAQQEILKVYGNTRLGKELPLSPGGFDRFSSCTLDPVWISGKTAGCAPSG